MTYKVKIAKCSDCLQDYEWLDKTVENMEFDKVSYEALTHFYALAVSGVIAVQISANMEKDDVQC